MKEYVDLLVLCLVGFEGMISVNWGTVRVVDDLAAKRQKGEARRKQTLSLVSWRSAVPDEFYQWCKEGFDKKDLYEGMGSVFPYPEVLLCRPCMQIIKAFYKGETAHQHDWLQMKSVNPS